jgi:hypothetical protein
MNEHRSRILPLLLLGSLAVPNLNAATAANPADQPAKPSTTYPQIVRVSYVEGDVRISRGKLADKLHGQESGDVTGWEQATANTPIESGSSLVTGDGRAEIELEDASTVYLAGNCVLEFGELSSTGGVPYTEMSLLSGTATLDIQTLMEGERLELSTPTDHLWLRYPQKAYMRVESYLDAVSVTPLKTMTLPMPGLAFWTDLQLPQRATDSDAGGGARAPGLRLGQVGGGARGRERCSRGGNDEGCRPWGANPRIGRDERPGDVLCL